MTRVDLVAKMSEAMARQEGFYVPGSRSARNNNPGNLRPWSKTQPRDDENFTKAYRKFDTLAEGWIALQRQIALNVFKRGLTWREFFAGKPGVYPGYAPAADQNRPVAYALFVLKHVTVGMTAALAPEELLDTTIAGMVNE